MSKVGLRPRKRDGKGKPLRRIISCRQLRHRVQELASQIQRDYGSRRPVLIGILKGGFVFLADLIRNLSLPLEVDFIIVSSYGHGRISKGMVTVHSEPAIDLAGRDVLLVEDIVDSGLTLDYLRRYLEARQPASLRVCALLARESVLAAEADIDYLGFPVPDGFVVGYGIDYAEQYRHLPDIYVLEEA